MIKFMCEQRSEAWYESRLGRITATSFKDVVAGKSTDTYKKLITRVASEIVSFEIEETYSNADMERGIELEQEAVECYEGLFDIKGYDCGLIIPDIDNHFSEWIGVSPDRMFENYGLEIKCPRSTTHMNYISENRLPNEYKWQVQGQLYVSKFEYWDFMSYHPKMKPFIIRVEPNKDMHNELEDRLGQAILDIKVKIDQYKNYDFLSK